MILKIRHYQVAEYLAPMDLLDIVFLIYNYFSLITTTAFKLVVTIYWGKALLSVEQKPPNHVFQFLRIPFVSFLE